MLNIQHNCNGVKGLMISFEADKQMLAFP